MATIKSFILRGPAGSGKTSLAEEIARIWGAENLYLLCHPWVTEEHLFKGVDLGKVALKDPAPYKNGILANAALLSHHKKVVVVIDELDKTKEFVDNLLLDFLQNGRVESAQGLVKANPENIVVFMTTNEHRDLSDPLLRRAAKFYIGFLPDDVELGILLGEIDGYWLEGKRSFIVKAATRPLQPVRDAKVAKIVQGMGRKIRGAGLDISTSELLHFLEFCSIADSRDEVEYAIEAWLEKTPDHAEFIEENFQGRKALAGNIYAALRS